MSPDYIELGDSECMGKDLRKEVERQLLIDLKVYAIKVDNLRFDWSDSCIEGKRAAYLDGSLENFSSIKLFDINDHLVADGWIDFVYEKNENLFIVYWDLLDTIQNGKMVRLKGKFGIPNHIFLKMSHNLQEKYEEDRIK